MLLNWIYNSSPLIVISVFAAITLAVATLVLIAVYAVTNRQVRELHGELADFTVTNIAVLYAVLLAFIAVATWESYTKASEVVQTEANLVGTLTRDTMGIPEPTAGVVRAEIGRYLEVVIHQEWPVQRTGRVSEVGWANLDRIHRQVAAISPANLGQAVLMEEMLRNLNELDRARTSRLDAAEGHIPSLVWFVILVLGVLTVGFTCLLKAERFWVHWLMMAGITTALTLVIALIVELDYPFRGEISVSTAPFEQVQTLLAETPA